MGNDQDRTLALLGIAATKKAQDEACPSENIMSAFIEDRVNPETRAMMLSHLNRCEDCYFVWEQLGAYIEQDTVAFVKQHKAHKVGFIQRFVNGFNPGFSWPTATSGIAVASLAIALMVNRPDAPHQDIYSDPASVVATLDTDTLAKRINQFGAPWENQTFGFIKSTYTSPTKAVGAGIWSARNTLVNSKDPLPLPLVSELAINWQDSEWRDYYAFGQWTLSAWVLANAEHVKPLQWIVLSQSLQTLETGLKQRQQSEPEVKIALQTIHKMKVSVDRLSRKEDLPAQRTLLREIERSLQKLFL